MEPDVKITDLHPAELVGQELTVAGLGYRTETLYIYVLTWLEDMLWPVGVLYSRDPFNQFLNVIGVAAVPLERCEFSGLPLEF